MPTTVEINITNEYFKSQDHTHTSAMPSVFKKYTISKIL